MVVHYSSGSSAWKFQVVLFNTRKCNCLEKNINLVTVNFILTKFVTVINLCGKSDVISFNLG